MSSITLAFSSRGATALAELGVGTRGVVVEVDGDRGRADRLLSLGVSAGASVTVLQTFPGVVFLCDQTELAVERIVARSIYVRVDEQCPDAVSSAPED